MFRFIPDDVYVNVFLTKNDEMFNAGYPVTAYTKDIDHYASQSKLDKLSKYLLASENIDQGEAITDWNYEFREWATFPEPFFFFFFLAKCLPSWPPSPEIRTARAKFTDFLTF